MSDNGQKGFGLSLLRLIMAVVTLLLALLFPGHPSAFAIEKWWRLPIELPLLIIILILVPVFLKRGLSAFLVLVIGSLLLLRLADIGSYLAFNRRFNPLLELHLIGDGWNLASTSTGPVQAFIVIVLALIVLFAIMVFLYRSLMVIANTTPPIRTITLSCAAAVLLSGSTLLAIEAHSERKTIVEWSLIPEIQQRVDRIAFSIEDQREFLSELDSDEVLDEKQPGFRALEGKDIIVMFIESYGRGFLDSERFRDRSHSLLNSAEQTLDSASLTVKSGWLTSPIRGGRSWLAHASFQAGLKIDNQARFDRLITTPRLSLSALFGQAGWKTIGIMPAIQFAWPEGSWYGYEHLYVSQDMEFSGDRFGYVTMPDQYTLSFFENDVRAKSDTPIMATMALLSTHAPWTPLPRILPWESIGDGSVYDGSHRYGERISWKYRSKVQDKYADSFDYTMNVVAEYAALYADDALIIVLGDHQPAPIINGWGNSGDVPVHIISNDKPLLDRLPDNFWVNGMIPAEDSDSLPMWDFRSSFSTIFE